MNALRLRFLKGLEVANFGIETESIVQANDLAAGVRQIVIDNLV